MLQLGDIIYAEIWNSYGIVVKFLSPHNVYCDIMWLDQPITTKGVDVSTLQKVS